MLEFFQTLSWAAVFQIIMIDILLGGDNAVVIALACRNLPEKQRLKGVLWGTAGAIILRVILIAFALTLLAIPYLKIIGALLLAWVAIRLLVPEEEGHGNIQSSATLWAAVKTIIIADLVMSLDNVIAIAGAAQLASPDHQLGLVIFGLVVSIPIIIWGSTIILKLIDRFPSIVTFGAGLLGWIAGGLMVTDIAYVEHFGEPSNLAHYGAQIAGAVLIILVGKWMASRAQKKADS